MFNRIALLLSTALVVFSLSGCVHKIDIQQGNVINPAAAKKVTLGMTSYQVKRLLGNPILVNLFSQHQIVYVYSFKQGYRKAVRRHLTITFQNNKVTHINVTP
ncbi:MAG: outer membrane protein assembly factor BamE [Gammaproteobacteria bacterium]|nr:outer membrane protein assembly factor BamE [Gammaproteobacteria bacterium]MCH9744649.1 outer membrane protein assembly factor BamE [Gammaproteobacteria bacterium]